MKLQIIYTTNSDSEYTCCAETEIRGLKHFGIGKTWEAAKENLLKKLNAVLGATVPAPETVEVKVAGEEMDTEFLPFEDRVIDPATV